MTQQELLAHLTVALEACGIPYMLAGSHASSLHGQPRATNDIDLVIDPTAEQLERFLALLGAACYVSPDAARAAFRSRSLFNIIDVAGGWKADLMIRKDRPFSAEELRRRQTATLGDRHIPVASPEDVILTKLEWDNITPSEQQLRDALHIAVVQWPRLDRSYLRRWAPALGVSAKLEVLLEKADELSRSGNS